MIRVLAAAVDVALAAARSAAGVGIVAAVWVVGVGVALVEAARSEEQP